MTSSSRAIACTTLVTCAFEDLPCPATRSPPVYRDAVVAWEGDTVVYAGPGSAWDGDIDERFDACSVVPGFVDCHTHLPFAGWRDDEYEARLAGRSYRELHGEGGIARSARMLWEATDEEVLGFSRGLADEMLAH